MVYIGLSYLDHAHYDNLNLIFQLSLSLYNYLHIVNQSTKV